MTQFSLVHWIIVLLILVPTVALTVVPSWRIARKAGFSGAWCLLLLVPGLNVLVIWAFAFTRWPNSQDANNRTSVSAIIGGVVLLAMLVLGLVLVPMLDKHVSRSSQKDMSAPQMQSASPQSVNPPASADPIDWESGIITAPQN